MSTERKSPRVTDKVIRRALVWPRRSFCQSFYEYRNILGDLCYCNESDPGEMAQMASEFISACRPREVLASIAPGRGLLIDDRRQRVGELSPGLVQVWRGYPMSEFPPAHYQQLIGFFQRSGVTQGFRGGILCRDEDCAVAARLLAMYAFDSWSVDVVFAWMDQPLALVAGHEADLHIHSSDVALLNSYTETLHGLGLKESPSPLIRPGDGDRPEPLRR